MAEASPSLDVVLCDVSSGKPIEHVLRQRSLVQVRSKAALSPISLTLRRSNAVLRLILNGVGSNDDVTWLKDGLAWPFERLEKKITTQFLVRDDIEHHSMSCVISNALCISLDISVHVFRQYSDSDRNLYFAAPKWSRGAVESELGLYLASKPKRATHRSSFDLMPRRITCGLDGFDRNSLQALQDVSALLVGLTYRLTRRELSHDYSESNQLDLDIDGTLEYLRCHPNTLLESPDGPIVVDSKRYTPVELKMANTLDGRLDLSLPISLIRECVLVLRRDDALGSLSVLLESALNRLTVISDVGSRRIPANEITSWLSSEPSTEQCRLLQHYIVLVVSLCRRHAKLTDRAKHGFRALSDKFRDFDLFEWSAFAAVCVALGAHRDASELSKSALKCGASTVINLNRDGGEILARALLQGWRDSSSVPSDYAPDMVINFEERVPIPLDAKFRVGNTITELCNADGLKDVQAYMNEFGVCGGVVIVPMIPRSIERHEESDAIRIQGKVHGHEYRIWVLEYSPDLIGFQRNLIAALEDIVSLADEARRTLAT